jgi:hypothetical protein
MHDTRRVQQVRTVLAQVPSDEPLDAALRYDGLRVVTDHVVRRRANAREEVAAYANRRSRLDVCRQSPDATRLEPTVDAQVGVTSRDRAAEWRLEEISPFARDQHSK